MPRRLTIALLLTVAAVTGAFFFVRPSEPRARAISHAGIHKIRHVVIVMQENRSFDSYFGTYPGRGRDPARTGTLHGLLARPALGQLLQARTTTTPDRNTGGPHEHLDAVRDIAAGKMDGFVREARRGLTSGCGATPDAADLLARRRATRT